jgi:hypothetical protein
MSVDKSKAPELMGKNARCPSLVPGTLYIIKEWTIKHHVNYDNPFQVVKFLGSGREDGGERTFFDKNPAINTMKDGDYYFFEAVDNKGETYSFGAYMFENCVCITSSAVRITCYEIKGHEPEGVPVKGPSKPRTQVATPSKASKRSADDDDAAPVEPDEDDGMGVPGAMLCHPLSMRPIKPMRDC